ncbi:DNA circularisation protein N-terminus [Bradyrhizobium erythrophlei]|nr:DNA circularisation protein N-terminus [Bradyrhizobium erythrophlei]
MTNIFDLPAVWRARMMPASFNGARFHCESNARESGRRIVEHQFPKNDLPYAEDMGRAAREFTIRGYCIVFPFEMGDGLRTLDYTVVRDALIAQLEAEGPGTLQLPTQSSQQVVCPRYRVTEEERFGGYCTIDMTFQEYGLDPSLAAPSVATATAVADTAQAVESQVQQSLAPPGTPYTGPNLGPLQPGQ